MGSREENPMFALCVANKDCEDLEKRKRRCKYRSSLFQSSNRSGISLTDAINWSRSFVENVKAPLGFKAKGRNIIEGGEGYHLRQEAAPYTDLFGAEKDDIAPENAYSWVTNIE